MNYKFIYRDPQQQFISIELRVKSIGKELELILPAWRPGRYELGDFAKNIKSFKVFSENGKPLKFEKTSKNKWVISTPESEVILVSYQYYAAEINAGSSYIDESQLYVNPVNCCFYSLEYYDSEIKLELEIPSDWKIASPILTQKNQLIASNFDELADSPFICSPFLQYNSYQVDEYNFHLWFNGLVKPDWERLKIDFEQFTRLQIEKFIEFPTKNYHFMFQILPYNAYHGVEHSACTVIALGPSYAVFEKLYNELLGVSSHELYHTWNVKSIRPVDLFPYDFSKENFSKLGYIAEGVTTYMGDLMLFRSGVFTLRQYLFELSKQIQRHLDNFGRFNYSVAESSFDTWLDGYSAGVPGRKVSIYTEGCIIAFALDVLIMKETKNKKRLDDVMRCLYHNYAKKGKGITEANYKYEIQNITGNPVDSFFEKFINGTNAFEGLINETLDYLGLKLQTQPHQEYNCSNLGFKTSTNGSKLNVSSIYPGSPYDVAGGRIGDIILSLNDVRIENNLNEWLNYFSEDSKSLCIERNGSFKILSIPEVSRTFYQTYWIVENEQVTKSQKDAFQKWMN